ncbi:MAG: phosphoglucosamine mutase [Planctomycetota bacterium]|nr:phosphoglucosamine mutase [Planctomycetota bacterium]
MTMIEPVKFGTDGLRGRAGEAPIDPATLRRVGAALGVLLHRGGDGSQRRVLIGDDGRESSPWIVESLVQGLMGAEVSAASVGVVTTPALALLTARGPYSAGVMISASHNPSDDNGVKIFAANGEKLSTADERELERLSSELTPESPGEPRIRSVEKSVLQYEELLGQRFMDLDLTGRRVCVDAANGGGAAIAPRVLRMFGAEVVEVGCAPDGFNINDGVGALHPEGLAPLVLEHGACMGICLDGDGDRGIFIDESGAVQDGDAVMAFFGARMHAAGQLPGGVVAATVMSNLGMHEALRAAGVEVHTTPVGDRNVVAAMREHGFALGGEQSGHTLFREHDLVGDGLYTGLRILEAIGDGKMSAAFAAFSRFPQKLVNVRVREKPDLSTIPAVAAKCREIESALGDAGRLLLRYSGTEPKCRVMIEARDGALCERLCDELAGLIQAELGA